MRMLVCVFTLIFGSVGFVSALEAGEPLRRQTHEALIRDIALQDGNTLQGQIVDAQGTAQIQSGVTLLQRGAVVRSTQTDSNGRFFIRDLRAGVYEVETSYGGGTFRLWAPTTAPPAATQGLLIVRNAEVVRGQAVGGIDGRTIVGGVLAAGVIGGATYWAIDYHKGSGS